jgi:DNA helicase-2/ATP-dependent DNA helicase PcrA
VGDDDQSLYRFRGATVELFAAFAKRFKQALGKTVQRSYLVQNYRSTPEIVAYYNAFIKEDTQFSGARIRPLKSDVKPMSPSIGLPVLGMFRNDVDELADSLATFIKDVFRGKGAKVPVGNDKTTLLKAASAGGNVGDAVLLASKVKEWQPGWGADPPKARLPLLLRSALARHEIDVFNPRGQALRDQEPVQTLLGLMLECLDPSDRANPQGKLSLQAGITRSGLTYFEKFRRQANNLIATNPKPNQPHTLKAFVKAWNTQTSQTSGSWPDEWPLLELGFTLLTWLPSFLDNPEQQIWLEAITRTISQAGLFSSYRSTLLREPPHLERSRTAAVRDVIRPIAEGLIDVEEDLVLTQPRDTFSIMTIHQAKGLEFPLVIVDVSSDFKRNHRANAFRRYPSAPSTVTRLEDELAQFCEVGATRVERSALDRAFDDIVRQYYVAFSRPQSCLLLVGLNASLGGNNPVQCVATGWRRDGTWSWMEQIGKKKPALANRLPFLHI